VIEIGYLYSHDYLGAIRVGLLAIANVGVAYWLYTLGAPKIVLGAVIIFVGILLVSYYINEYRQDW